ncbi:MAG: 50S ribosomal protein L11 methyltransferase [Chitinophagaceae bacterium]|nr:MAG: 50S ribosomal protein L11 methyltransferase [Chitinophagaceae bacterium]
MKQYQQYRFTITDQQQAGLIIALLSAHDFTGMEEQPGWLDVFFNEDPANDQLVAGIAATAETVFTKNMLDDQNWNQLWESNFDPVLVDDFVSIRASFHEPAKGVEHEIVVTPKMSFGTGHHATTWSMVSQMRQVSFNGKSVFDFGTGTGILAILAEKLGAVSVLAIDNDPWSIENAKENAVNNNCSRITLIQADDASGEAIFDVILANINRNVLLDNMHTLRARLAIGGTLLMSGLLPEDEAVIVESATAVGFKAIGKVIRSNWLCLKFSDL